ncbi:MAG: TlpA family protein disulfide reductase [Betaproteobacteria bacterium]|nr:TlpA family protein disulfide reductase [Betaproteobacteria bacterium]
MSPSLPRRLSLRALGAGLALVGAGVGPGAAANPPGAQRRPWPAGLPTPPLALPAWEAPAWKLADARGQVVVLNFWASWCEPCRAEMPSLALLAQRHAADRLQVVTVNFRETDAAIRRFLTHTPLDLPILRDVDGDAARAWRVSLFPTTVVVGRQGRPVFTVLGELDWTSAIARSWIAPLL